MRIGALAASTLVPLALVAGCGQDGDDDDARPDAAEAAGRGHNGADVEFARSMILHHRQAAAMAALADDAAADPAIGDLADRVEQAQQPEIDAMSAWLEAWGEDVPADDRDMPSGDAESGILGDHDTGALEAASGPTFDSLFAELMIEHHRGAIAMADEEIAAGQDDDAVALAEAIVAAQQAEISELQAFLDGTG